MNILLAFLCAAGLFFLQRQLYQRFWKKNLILSLSFSQSSAREGERLRLSEMVLNKKFLPLPVLRVKFSVSRHLLFEDQRNSNVSDQFYRNDILSVMMYQKLTRNLDFTCGKRGFYTINRIDAVTSDIFLSANMVEVIPCQLQLSVYPRLIDGEDFDILFRQMFGTVLARRVINEDPFEFRGIREYQPHDSLRSVNFKASAKTGSLKVNQHDDTSSQQVSILLNLELPTIWQYEELLEEAIRLASTLTADFLAGGIPISFVTNGSDQSIPAGSGRGHDTVIDELLCRIDTSIPVPSFLPVLEEILEEIRNKPNSEDTLVLISTYEQKDFTDFLHKLSEEHIPFFWIVPLHEDMQLEIPEDLKEYTIRWHVNRVA